MRDYHTTDEVRAAEAVLFEQVAEGVPMQRAAYGLARVCAAELRDRTGGVVGRRVCLLVGSGDNGGDALWAGSMLRRRGAAVTALLLSPAKAHAKGLAALRASGGRMITELTGQEHRDALAAADLVVDGIVGISGRGSLRPDAARIVAEIEAPIVAADLPSGVDPDTGAVAGPAVRAEVTVSFGALKPVHVLAAEQCGRVELVPIGLAPQPASLRALEPGEVGALWPVPDAHADKYSQGVVGVWAGSARYPGAGVLCTAAAVAATSGMVRYAGSGAEQVLARSPEIVAASSVAETGKVQAWVFGPGSGTDDAALDTLRQVLATDVPVLVDADGLTMLAKHPGLVRERSAPTVLTPHAGEFERLTGAAPGEDRIGAAREFASRWGVTVLLKGRATLVAAPDGPVLVNEAGGSWAATAGAGDVLAGIIGALLSSGLNPALAAAAGARAHALAGNLAASTAAGNAGWIIGSATAPISADSLLVQVRAAIAVLRAQTVGDRPSSVRLPTRADGRIQRCDD